ncbi:MAG: hypothetical protein ACREO1_01220 [Arenimonas sp.]
MSWYSNTAILHAAVGTTALVTFWIAGMAKKGSPVHKTSGKIYLLAMVGILLSAFPMATYITIYKQHVIGSFLLYLLIITATSVWNSWRSIRDKRDWKTYTGPVYKGLMVLNLLGGLAIAGIGLFLAERMQMVITSFSLIGILSAYGMYKFQREAPTEPRWWMREHLTAMIGNGVATHIAFLQIGLPKMLPMIAGPVMVNVAWMGPLLIAVVAGFYLTRKYVPKRPALSPKPKMAELT